MKIRKFCQTRGGYSLMELIAVLAVLAACGGLLTANLALIPRNEAKKCARSIDAALSACKIEAMTKTGGMSLRLYADEGGSTHITYLSGDGGTEYTDETVANRLASVTVNGTALTQSGVTWSFERDTGKITAGREFTVLVISGGGRGWTITLYPLTGAHVLNGREERV